MITTPQLIETLVGDLKPVRPLKRPVLRCAAWLGLASVVVLLVAVFHGMRPDLAEQMRQPAFLVSLGAALATGILAALAAFLASLPDRSRWWLLLPLPTLIVWMSTLGQQCLTNWVAAAPDGGVMPGDTAKCFFALVVTGLPLQIGLLIMLRHAAPLRPIGLVLTGALAVAAITCAALLVLNRNLDATALVLISNLGMAGAILGFVRLFAPRLLPGPDTARNRRASAA